MDDAAIIGGGPVGLGLAVLLAQQGWTVRVFERRHGISGHSRAIGLHPPAQQVLARAGLAAQLAEQGTAIRRGLGISNGRRIAALDFASLPGPYPYVLALPEHQTVALLRERLRALDPLALSEGREFRGIEGQSAEAIRFTVAGPGGLQATEASWLIGADGVQSAVRAELGVAFHGRGLPDRYLMGDFPETTAWPHSAALFIEAQGIVESFPLPGGMRRWVARLGRGQPADADLPELIRERTGYRVDAEACTMRSCFSTANRRAASMMQGRAVLLGDAAHQISPIGGQGMCLGLIGAARLADLLASGAVPGGGQLLQFQARQLKAARQAGLKAHVNMALGRPVAPWLLPARNLLFSAAAANRTVSEAVARSFTMT
ncbi:NAD(P)/FAD-dependent oxidoreductase [Glutamicibacter protophormiae]|uniref:FAD-dependent oxidoreductase n=1 Tax=Glutamicibacter protophormiae TaxID=37930 RepID=UPI002A83A009|nr:NAD(P)/FAD-dependent oxidoreductase [Glutamicibacter protophormiae]WPR64242.1 NAD(P)/FAD-dependent oxidoreductase [Glutamicibacter protophormiae]WPR67735.1 NAD(P)/FAD-dependent oxidoreductase [Glutamicibacter protophormiae]